MNCMEKQMFLALSVFFILCPVGVLISCSDGGDDDDSDSEDEDEFSDEELCADRLSDIGPYCFPSWQGHVDQYCSYYEDAAFDFELCWEDWAQEIHEDPDCVDNSFCDPCNGFNNCLWEQYTPS